MIAVSQLTPSWVPSYSPAFAPSPLPRALPVDHSTSLAPSLQALQVLDVMQRMLDLMAGMLGMGGGVARRMGVPELGSALSAPAGVPDLDAAYGSSSSGRFNVQGAIGAVPAAQREAARKHFPIICSECERQGVGDKAQVAYILATALHESGGGAHMEEFASGRAYEGRRDLGNTQAGDGTRFKGRGYVQVTGRRNYQDWSRRLGVDLVGNPAAAKDPAIAARILVQGMKEGTFTGKRLGDFVGNGRQDFQNARRVVNGTDKAGSIAQSAQRIQAAL